MIDEYLALLGIERAEPSVRLLLGLHRAHVSRVPYTNLQILRGRSAPAEPGAAMRQILDGHGGYCFHLNGALSLLLRELGFSVTLHRGYVRQHGETGPADLNHLVLLVHDLEGAVWFVDVGLGDAIYEPLPLSPGNYRQGPFDYSLGYERERWVFTHDPRGSFGYMEFEPSATAVEAFADAHHRLSTSPASPFRKFLVSQVRRADALLTLRACTRTLIDDAGSDKQVLTSSREAWAAAYAETGLSNVDDLWEGSLTAHEQWLASL